MNTNDSQNTESTPFPSGLFGYVVTNASGELVQSKGETSKALEEFTPYFNQLSDLIGDSLGFEEASDLVLLGKKQNTLCTEIDGFHFGAVFKPKGKINEISDFLKEKGDDYELPA